MSYQEAITAVSPRSSPQDQLRNRSWAPLAVIVTCSLIVRLACLLLRPMVIEREGAYIGRVAQNLAAGHGMVGMHARGLQLLYPPLHPMLIAAVSILGFNVELASRLVSLLFGTLTVFPIWSLAKDLYGKRVAHFAATLVALHPVLVLFSVSTYSEPTYLFFVYVGILWSLRSARGQSSKLSMLAGAAFGLAYLIRPEGLLLCFATAALAIMYGREQKSKAFKIAIYQVAVFTLIAIPYVIFLKVQTGQFRLEAKSNVNFALSRMLLAGKSLPEVDYAIDPDLTPRGVVMRSDLDTLLSTKVDLSTEIRMIRAAARKNIHDLFVYLFKEQGCGGIALIGLIALGLFGSPWTRQRFKLELTLAALLACFLVPFFSLIFFNSRFVMSFLPILLVWAANGVSEFSWWAGESAGDAFSIAKISRAQALGTSCAVAGLLLVGWATISSFPDLKREDPVLKAVGLQLHAKFPGAARIMDVSPVIAFYDGAILRNYPYTDPVTALRYIAASQVDLLILPGEGIDHIPYLRRWQREGIPDARAELVLTVPSKDYGDIKVYRWHNQ